MAQEIKWPECKWALLAVSRTSGQEIKWPESKRALLAVSRFTRNASKSHNAMSYGSASQHVLIKDSTLRAYELMSEAYHLQYSELIKM